MDSNIPTPSKKTPETPTSLFEWAGESRRHLAIVFTDMVASTAIGIKLGDEAMYTIKVNHRDQIWRLTSERGGYFIKWTGDGALVVFKNSNDALDFALQLRESSGAPEVHVRIGIHVGEVNITQSEAIGNDILGQNVDIASRIMTHGVGAELWLSNDAYKAINSQNTQKYRDLHWESDTGTPLKSLPKNQILWQYLPERQSLWRKSGKAVAKTIYYWELLFIVPLISLLNSELYSGINYAIKDLIARSCLAESKTGDTHLQIYIAGFLIMATTSLTLGAYGYYRGFRDRGILFLRLFFAMIPCYLCAITGIAMISGEFVFAQNYDNFAKTNTSMPVGSTIVPLMVRTGVILTVLLFAAFYMWLWGLVGAWYRRRLENRKMRGFR